MRIGTVKLFCKLPPVVTQGSINCPGSRRPRVTTSADPTGTADKIFVLPCHKHGWTQDCRGSSLDLVLDVEPDIRTHEPDIRTHPFSNRCHVKTNCIANKGHKVGHHVQFGTDSVAIQLCPSCQARQGGIGILTRHAIDGYDDVTLY